METQTQTHRMGLKPILDVLHSHNVKLDGDGDVDANANVKCEQAVNSRFAQSVLTTNKHDIFMRHLFINLHGVWVDKSYTFKQAKLVP